MSEATLTSCRSKKHQQLNKFWNKLIKFKSPTPTKPSTAGDNEMSSINMMKKNKPNNVKDEYMEAFRTKSYIDICSKVQTQMRATIARESSTAQISADGLLEPNQEILINMIQKLNLHDLLIDYFEASLQACRICEFLLQCIDRTRENYGIIQRVIKLSRRERVVSEEVRDDRLRIMFKDLAKYADLDNPLSISNQLQFGIVHDRYGTMLDRLTMKQKRIRRRVKVISVCKKALGISLALACGGLAAVALVLALHSVVGIVVAPCLLGTSNIGWFRRIKNIRPHRKGISRSSLMKLYAQLDAAAKGVYTLNRDFDTMSRLVIRLHDEIEHGKSIAELCVKYGKRQLLKEVVKEFQAQEPCFLEKLVELEDHVCLCVLTINRARRLVIQETMVQPKT